MLMKGITEDKNHTPILHFTELSVLNCSYKRWFSLSCFGVHVVLDCWSAFYRRFQR